MYSKSMRPAAVLAAAVVLSMPFHATAPAIAQQMPARAAALPDFTDLYVRQGPTVVSIDVTQKARRQRFPDISEDDPFYEFFRRFGQIPRNGPGGQQREFETQSTGSGFIISPDGYIVTNAHVVDDANEVTVRLSDKREFVAKVIGSDERTDTSLLKIDATDLPRVAIGDPDKLRVGEWVVAIGKPFGLENTMTAGIVSAKGRDLPQENLVPFIQTDVAINPGNSGGPLFNMKGEVVGINSLIYSRTGGYMGLAFAVPIDVAMNAVTQLREKGRVTRGRIGVQIQEMTKETADAFGLAQANGALVNNVERDGPAAKGGVQSGDIILKVEGRDVHSSTELPRIITQIRPGTKVTLTVWRKGAAKEIPVVVAEMKEDTANASPRRANPAPKEKPKPNKMGLVLSDLNDEQRKTLDLPAGGVLIEDVVGVVRGNVQPGDVILSIIQHGSPIDVKSPSQVNDYLAKLDKSAPVTFQLRRGDQTFYATLKAGEAG
jgi:serine protease Do